MHITPTTPVKESASITIQWPAGTPPPHITLAFEPSSGRSPLKEQPVQVAKGRQYLGQSTPSSPTRSITHLGTFTLSSDDEEDEDEKAACGKATSSDTPGSTAGVNTSPLGPDPQDVLPSPTFLRRRPFAGKQIRPQTQSGFSNIPGVSEPLSPEMHAALDRLHERQELDRFVARTIANGLSAVPNPFDEALNHSPDTAVAFSKSPTVGVKTVYVCFGGGPAINIWTDWQALRAANPVDKKRFARGFASMTDAKEALMLVKLYGGLGKDVSWNKGYWVVLHGQDPGWCYGRLQAAIRMGHNYEHARVRLASTAAAAEKMFKTARRAGQVAVV